VAFVRFGETGCREVTLCLDPYCRAKYARHGVQMAELLDMDDVVGSRYEVISIGCLREMGASEVQ
jgi:hypothetical protein